MGQALDLMSEDKSQKLEDFTMERYTQIVQYKTSYYTFYLPIQLGMVLVSIQMCYYSILYISYPNLKSKNFFQLSGVHHRLRK